MSRVVAPLSHDSLSTLLSDRLDVQPEGRKAAVIASFSQVAALVGGRIGRDSLRLAMQEVSTPRDGDTPPITARRATCAAVAAALVFLPGELQAALDAALAAPGRAGDWTLDHGGFRPARLWFQAQIDAWEGSTDPRLAAMAATAARELAELPA